MYQQTKEALSLLYASKFKFGRIIKVLDVIPYTLVSGIKITDVLDLLYMCSLPVDGLKTNN